MISFVVFSLLLSVVNGDKLVPSVQLGPRPFWLVDQMRDTQLKKDLREYPRRQVFLECTVFFKS